MSTLFKGFDDKYVVDTDGLFEVIRHSLRITRHIEFFMWLQAYVTEYIPHDILVATWGDFNSQCLHYDVASNVPEVHTQQLIAGCYEIDPLMRDLYHQWHENDNQCFVLNNLDELTVSSDYPGALIDGLKKMKSVLVFGYRDHRGNSDCLYAFFNDGSLDGIQEYVLSMLMPHVDAALRRVECLPASDDINGKTTVVAISQRERDVMTWVKQGKTNEEIAIILDISPNTVKNHLKNIFRKMKVCTRAQAVAIYQADALANTNIRGVINESVFREKTIYCENTA